MLLNGSLGQLVKVPTNAVPANLLPPSDIGVESQVPQPARGAQVADPVLQRQQEAQDRQAAFEFFPAAQPKLMPYLGSLEVLGNTAIRPGALIATTPWDALAQSAKYRLSQYGLSYALQQTATFVTMTDVKQGDNTLAYYTLNFPAKWAVFSTAGGGSAGWISSQLGLKSGLGYAGGSQDAKSNLGTLTDPTGIWSGVNGIRVQELAWQQSLFDGHLVAVAGMVNQGNYFDANTYANSGRGQYLNSALINSMVLPLPAYNFGANLQWQPRPDWYAMLGGSVGKAPAGQVPWTDFNWNNWSLLSEFGFAPKDVLGLGPGVYRIQPFLAQAGGPTQAGLCFNLQQQLGKDAPFGWFGRFGFGGEEVSAGAAAQVGTGFAIRGPLEQLGLAPSRSNDGVGLGFLWSQPSASSATVVHENEFGLEAIYVLQLTPMAKLQSDFQAIWDPAYNPNASHAFVIQIQLALAW
jgi:porin